MLENIEVAESFLDKQYSNLTIRSTFSPSPFESYKCLIKLMKRVNHSEWTMRDLCIYEKRNKDYVSVCSLYSDELLNHIKEYAIAAIKVPQGA